MKTMGVDIIKIKARVALFGTATVTGYALYGTVKNLVTEPALFVTVRKKLKSVAIYKHYLAL